MSIASTSGTSLRQISAPPEPIGATKRQAPTQSATRPALLTAEQAAREVYGVSERTFHDMRNKGLVPAPVVLGPRLLRWHRHELEDAIARLPRQEAPLPVPAQLRRSRAGSRAAAE